ncbi:hypothetical protein [Xanthomonas axonopodis]|uniref:hypothetical protein n=1 Tax=Xanthomonas axonopodis TaxID=53413 RepID=UPI003555CA89
MDANKLLAYLDRKYWRDGTTEIESTTVSHNCALRPKARMDAAVDVLIHCGEIVTVPHERDKRNARRCSDGRFQLRHMATSEASGQLTRADLFILVCSPVRKVPSAAWRRS